MLQIPADIPIARVGQARAECFKAYSKALCRELASPDLMVSLLAVWGVLDSQAPGKAQPKAY